MPRYDAVWVEVWMRSEIVHLDVAEVGAFLDGGNCVALAHVAQQVWVVGDALEARLEIDHVYGCVGWVGDSERQREAATK